MKLTAADAVVRLLANEGRRVLSDWRALILLRRATIDTPPHGRRWQRMPDSVDQVRPILRQMERRGELAPVPQTRYIYEVTVPYAGAGGLAEDEILMEVNPYAALSHLSALAFHGLTEELPQALDAITLAQGRAGVLPPGTDSSDWEGLPPVRSSKPAKVLGRPVRWRSVRVERFFGVGEYRPRRYPVRVTTPERTLLDGLQHPEACGGLQNVLRAWVSARDTLDLDTLVDYVDLLDIGVLRQRAGFVLDELGLDHPALQGWRGKASRGGSSKLSGSAPYAPTYSESWSLSINAPVEVLREGVA